MSTGTASTSSPSPGPPALPAMKSQNKKHLQGQGMGTARDTQPPRHGDGATEQRRAKQTGRSKCWVSTAMTQPLHGQSGENSGSPRSEGLHGQAMVGNRRPGGCAHPARGLRRAKEPRQDIETNAVSKPQGSDKMRTESALSKGSTSKEAHRGYKRTNNSLSRSQQRSAPPTSCSTCTTRCFPPQSADRCAGRMLSPCYSLN